MSVFAFALVLESESHSCDQLSELMGVRPTRCWELGALVSSRHPGGPFRKVTRWRYEVGGDLDDTEACLAALRPLLRRLEGVPDVTGASPAVVIGLQGRSTGWMLTLLADDIALLARSGCGLAVDCYGVPESEDDLVPRHV